jgi:hypothetical protein
LHGLEVGAKKVRQSSFFSLLFSAVTGRQAGEQNERVGGRTRKKSGERERNSHSHFSFDHISKFFVAESAAAAGLSIATGSHFSGCVTRFCKFFFVYFVFASNLRAWRD